MRMVRRGNHLSLIDFDVVYCPVRVVKGARVLGDKLGAARVVAALGVPLPHGGR